MDDIIRYEYDSAKVAPIYTSKVDTTSASSTSRQDIVDDIFTSLQSTFDREASKYSLSPSEKEQLIMKLRTKLQIVYPSSMGVPRISKDITECIGETKLVRINNTQSEGRVGEVVAKLEVRIVCSCTYHMIDNLLSIPINICSI